MFIPQSIMSITAILGQAGAATGENDAALIWGLILLAVSIVLIVAELFVPSGGLISVLAGVSAVASIVAFFRYDVTWGWVALGMYVVLGPMAVVYGFKWWIHSPLGRRMILGGTLADEDPLDPDAPGAISQEHARRERMAAMRQLIGARGVAVTLLRPVGTVKIDGQRLDAMADVGTIEPGTPVVVTDFYDNQVKVRAAE
jgi:membrane-bound serine protease (ClpP class)